MEIHTLILYLIESIILFILLNKVLRITDRVVHYAILSSIYILVISGINTVFHISNNNDSVFIILLFEMLLRICYTNLIEENNFFHQEYMKRYIITFLVVFGLNTYFISKVSTVFLSLEQVKVVLWLLIIFYVIDIIKRKEKVVLVKNKKDDKNIKRKVIEKKESIVVQYAKLKNKYFSYIKTSYKELIPLIYAIMLYENRNKPELFRKIDYYLYKLDGKGRKFGIMQIYSKYYIDDENSISIAIRRLEKLWFHYKNHKDVEKMILKDYYQKNNIVSDVLFIMKEIKSFDHK